jgi:hypothetical protein
MNDTGQVMAVSVAVADARAVQRVTERVLRIELSLPLNGLKIVNAYATRSVSTIPDLPGAVRSREGGGYERS